MHEVQPQDTILVVDDNKNNLDLMLVTLSEHNYRLLAATSGERALKIAQKVEPDLILMDIQMPGIDGYETARLIKEELGLTHVPILFLSALNDLNNIVKCFATGGVDYISKPFKKEELLARVETHLSIKHLRSQIQSDRDKISAILNTMIPERLITKVKSGIKPDPELHEETFVLFSDFVGFTSLVKEMGASEGIDQLNKLFTGFDDIVTYFGLERIKTIGDAYMAVAGVNTQPLDRFLRGIMTALKMHEFIKAYNQLHQTEKWKLRIGAHAGPVVAGIIGFQKIAFDVWGNTVNLSSRLETNSLIGGVNVSVELYELVKDYVTAEPRGIQELHNWGEHEVVNITGLRPDIPDECKRLFEEFDLNTYLSREMGANTLSNIFTFNSDSQNGKKTA